MTHVTDHAIVRYLERVKGIDMDIVRADILSPAINVAIEFGAPTVIGRDGHRRVIVGGVVQTVLSKRGRR